MGSNISRPNKSRQGFPDTFKKLIPHLMTECVIDSLQVIYIHVYDGGIFFPFPPAARNSLLQQIVKTLFIIKACQGIRYRSCPKDFIFLDNPFNKGRQAGHSFRVKDYRPIPLGFAESNNCFYVGSCIHWAFIINPKKNVKHYVKIEGKKFAFT